MKDLQIRRYYREQFCDREPEIVTEFFITNSYPQPQNLIGTVTDEYSELIFKQIMRNESQIMTLLYKDETDDDLIPLYLMNYLQEDFCTQDFKIVHSPVAFPIQAKEKIIQDYLARIEIFNSNFICFSVFYHPKLDESELIFCTDGTAAKNELLKHLQNALTSKSRHYRFTDIHIPKQFFA